MLHLSAILVAKKLRPINGNKESAVKGFRVLEQAGLGKVIENTPQRGATIVSPNNIVKMCNTSPILLIDISI